MTPQQTTEQPTGYAAWFTKSEVAHILQCSEKTVERLVARGRLEQNAREVEGKKHSIYNPDDVNRVSAEMAEREAGKALAVLEPAAVAPAAASAVDQMADMLRAAKETVEREAAGAAEAAAKHPPVELFRQLHLNMDEAAAYSGLPRRLILRLIQEQKLVALLWSNHYYVNRESLERFSKLPA